MGTTPLSCRLNGVERTPGSDLNLCLKAKHPLLSTVPSALAPPYLIHHLHIKEVGLEQRSGTRGPFALLKTTPQSPPAPDTSQCPWKQSWGLSLCWILPVYTAWAPGGKGDWKRSL